MAGLLATLTLVPLAVAAWRDVAARLIPDQATLCIAALGIGLRAAEGLDALLASLATAAALFLLLAWAHARGAIGGGDVKLAAAIALGLPPLATGHFLILTALAGGVLAAGYLLGAALLPRPAPLRPSAGLLRRILAVEHRRVRRKGPLPYGVAIAIGAAFVHLQPLGG
ncbi:A24 family peptidase [Roseicella aerolata]|uniref:A24 family peptidase n=1 Tax=Roseicella aerolata TaxID=2883479 RepID=A0A9X1IHM7_9PROT|nr:A24 family peptidase [Roseicella aerolata]MCB4824760.1 A24 family peptidase [Roseicella aerolata]